jgi:putative ABC transport system permease protein
MGGGLTAGAANAAVIATGSNATGLTPTVTGVGHILAVPYFTTQGTNKTLLNIVNSISMSVSARMKQYGILRAIGMDDAQLKRMISAEAGTYAVSGLVVGIALGLVLNRKLYILLITHYFGAAWQVPWGCLAVIVVVVLAAVVLAVYNPVRRILMQPITATISEL